IELLHKNMEVNNNFQEWNAYVTELEAGDTISFAGMSLYELDWKKKFGINIVYIRRNDKTIHLPDGKERIFPKDKVGVLGTDVQIARLKLVFDQVAQQVDIQEEVDISDIQLIKTQITDANPYSG